MIWAAFLKRCRAMCVLFIANGRRVGWIVARRRLRADGDPVGARGFQLPSAARMVTSPRAQPRLDAPLWRARAARRGA